MKHASRAQSLYLYELCEPKMREEEFEVVLADPEVRRQLNSSAHYRLNWLEDTTTWKMDLEISDLRTFWAREERLSSAASVAIL